MIEIKKLKCLYNGKIVGYLIENKSGKIIFEYDDDWVKNGFSISPFSLPLSKKKFVATKDTLGGLFGVFFDSLPDGWGELLTRRMLSQKGINYDRISPLTKLSLIGADGLGALTYVPSYYVKNDDKNCNLDFLAVEVSKILNSKECESLDTVFRYGGSSGGARPKAHILINGEEWIVKFPTHFDPDNVGELEYKANLIAKECGIDVAEFKLFNSDICSGYFGSKRFDRNENIKVHMISLSSLLETSHRIPNLDYIHYLKVIQKICVNQEDMYEGYRRMCFNVLYKNKDDHGKNFSFIYDEKINGYKLSPAYDITSLPNKHEHEMTVNANGNPDIEDLLNVGKIMNLKHEWCLDIIHKVQEIIKKYS